MEKHQNVITHYKYCFVPMCPNNVVSAPDKIYFAMPQDANVRENWCHKMRRDKLPSRLSTLHCCEDHFDVEKDTDNYIRYKIMAIEHGQKMTLKLKKGVVPHKFRCQRQPFKKGKKKALVSEAIAQPAAIDKVSFIKEELDELNNPENEVKTKDPSAVHIKEEMHSESWGVLQEVDSPLGDEDSDMPQQGATQLQQEAALSQQEAALSQQGAALSQQEAALSQQEAALSQQGVALSQKEAALSQQKAALSQQGAALSQQGAALSQQGAALSQQEAALSQQGAALSQQGAALSQLGSALSQQETALSQQGAALSQLGSALSQQETALSQQGAALSQLGSALSQQETALSPQGAALSQLGSALSLQETALSPVKLEFEIDIEEHVLQPRRVSCNNDEIPTTSELTSLVKKILYRREQRFPNVGPQNPVVKFRPNILRKKPQPRRDRSLIANAEENATSRNN